MANWRLWISAAALVGLLWWTYPNPGATHDADATEVTVWFNDLIEGRHLDVVDAFEREFSAEREFQEYAGTYRTLLGSSAVRGGVEAEGNPQRLMCGIAGGVPPEVVEYDRFAICQWAARNAFLDLTPFIKQDLEQLQEHKRKLESLRRGDAAAADIARQERRIAWLEKFIVRPEDYYDAPWNECTYKGGLYGIAHTMDDRVMYYNSDMLIRGGFTNPDGTPKPPDTWEQVLTKRVDTQDAEIAGDSIRSASADFVAADVRPGDTLVHLSESGMVTRCLVDAVSAPTALTVRSAYALKKLALPDGRGQHIKVFDQDSYAIKLSRWDDEGNVKAIGFEPSHGNGWLFHYGWANGGEFMSDDGRTCTLNEPRIVEALEFITDIYDMLGGYTQANAFKKSFQRFSQDPFARHQIGMFVHGDWFLRELVRFHRDLRFGTYPLPVPAARAAAGHRKITWVGGFAYCIPSTCPQEKRQAAWWLVKYLSSVTGNTVLNEHDAQRERSQGRVYMPRIKANKTLNQHQLDTYVHIAEMPERVRNAMMVHIDLLDHARFRPVSPEGHKLWNAQADAQEQAWNHSASPRGALDLQTAKVQRALDKFHAPQTGRRVHWANLVYVYFGLLAAVALVVWLRHRSRNVAYRSPVGEWRAGLLFAAPWMVGFIVLAGGPMVFSLVMSVTDYDVINDAVFVGASNYQEMFTTDWANVGGVRQALLNTLYMGLGLPIGMAVGLALAMLLAVEVRGVSLYRTTFFLPAIMPVVAASVLWIWVFNAQNGLMNWMLQSTGIEALLDWIGVRTPISWLTNQHTSKPALIIMGLWGAGASMIIWLAGLKEIPKHLYEAAALDGAGPIRRFFTVTLPMLSPYILFNLTMGLIQTFQIFTQAYIMTPNGSPARSTYFFVYKLFDECFTFFRLGYGAALAWVLFVIVIGLTLVNMALSKKWVHYAGD